QGVGIDEGAVAIANTGVLGARGGIVEDNVQLAIAIHVPRLGDVIGGTPEERLENKVTRAGSGPEISSGSVLVVNRDICFAIAGVVSESNGGETGTEYQRCKCEPTGTV